MDAKHEIENELQRPTPREIKCRTGMWGTVAPLWVVLLPHTWIAVVAPFFLLVVALQTFCPDQGQGTVTRCYTYKSKNQSYNAVEYRFLVDGKAYVERTNVDADRWSQYDSGQPVTVRYTRLAPWFNPRIDCTDMWPILAFGIFWVVIWDGFMLAMIWAVWQPYLRSRWLCRNGKATAGQISDVQVIRGKGMVCRACYKFEAVDRSSGRVSQKTFDGKMTIPWRQRDAIKAGQSVTIVYDENNPRRSIVYQLGTFKAA